MKKIKLLLTAIIALAFSSQSYSQTFHAIIFADTEDPSVGSSVKHDYEMMQNEIGMIANATGMSLATYYNAESNANKERLLTILQNLRCEPEDVVMFYYSGHGGRAVDDRSKFPQIRFDASDAEAYPIYKIDETIASKHPKFRIVLGDMCNSVSNSLTVKNEIGSGKSIIKSEPAVVYQNLFKNLKGSVIATSSKAGETSAALPDGGAFTICFLNELGKIVSGNHQPNWNVLMENTQKSTLQVAQHTPVYEVNIGSGTSQPSSPSPIVGQQTNNPFINALTNMADNGASPTTRIRSVQTVLYEYFDSPHAIVEIFGKDGKIRLARENAQNFLERVSTSFKLISFVELEVRKTESGKITYVKLHEIYKQ
jgi:hypothetical protein